MYKTSIYIIIKICCDMICFFIWKLLIYELKKIEANIPNQSSLDWIIWLLVNLRIKIQIQNTVLTSLIYLPSGNGTPLQYSCLENPMDGGAWWAAVHGITKSRTWLSNFTFTFHFYALEKQMATHSSVLAWRVPGTAEPGGLPSMGSHRVGHDWSDLAAAAVVQW